MSRVRTPALAPFGPFESADRRTGGLAIAGARPVVRGRAKSGPPAEPRLVRGRPDGMRSAASSRAQPGCAHPRFPVRREQPPRGRAGGAGGRPDRSPAQNDGDAAARSWKASGPGGIGPTPGVSQFQRGSFATVLVDEAVLGETPSACLRVEWGSTGPVRAGGELSPERVMRVGDQHTMEHPARLSYDFRSQQFGDGVAERCVPRARRVAARTDRGSVGLASSGCATLDRTRTLMTPVKYACGADSGLHESERGWASWRRGCPGRGARAERRASLGTCSG